MTAFHPQVDPLDVTEVRCGRRTPAAAMSGDRVPISAEVRGRYRVWRAETERVPVFWACGVTPQAVALESCPELMITHEPGIMFLTDLPREGETQS